VKTHEKVVVTPSRDSHAEGRPSEIAIEAVNLTYTHASRVTPAFADVSVTVNRGERVLLTGDSGAGKSTLLSLIAGLITADDEGEQHGTLTVRGAVGMVLQDPDSQVICSRVGDNVAFGAENLGVPPDEIWKRVEESLVLVGLNVSLEHRATHLSGGQKQRLALAGILAMKPDIIILDEPTANLDPEGARDIVAAVDSVARVTGATLIVVEHEARLWLDRVDTIYRLDGTGLHEIAPEEAIPHFDLPEHLAVPQAVPAIVETHELQTAWGAPRTMRLPLGYSTVLRGANGTGKTTLALTLAGLEKPRGGDMRVADELRKGLRGLPHTWKSRDLARRIGCVFQNPEHQFVARTVLSELSLSGAPKERVDELVERLRLGHLVDANPFTLSGGEKRRLSVATALANAPRLVILDEPTFGQDQTTFVELISLIRELTLNGVTVLSITHDPVFEASLGDHVEVVQ